MIISRKIERSRIDANAIYGFVLDKSENLTYLAYEYDFQIDGFKIIRNEDISSSQVTPASRYCSKIMQKEGLLDILKNPPELEIKNWVTVFQQLKRNRKIVIIENEEENDFFIGPIYRVGKQSVTIRGFDGTGKWQEKENVAFSVITSVAIDCRYIRFHEKYLRKYKTTRLRT